VQGHPATPRNECFVCPRLSEFSFSLWPVQTRASHPTSGWVPQLRLNRNVCAREWERWILDFSPMQASLRCEFVHQRFCGMLIEAQFRLHRYAFASMKSYYARTVAVLLTDPKRSRSFISSLRRRLIAIRSGFLPLDTSLILSIKASRESMNSADVPSVSLLRSW